MNPKKLPLFSKFFIKLIIVNLGLGGFSRAADATWGSNGNSAWLTAGNWVGGIPGVSAAAASNTDTATFTNAFSGTQVGINSGSNGFNLGAVSVTSARTTALNIGNSGGTATLLRLYGATVNSVANTILRNAGSGLLTLQAAQNGTMGVVISNAADNKIYIDSTGGVSITSIISGANNLSLNGSGSGALTLSGANTFGGSSKNFTLAAGTLNINNASALGNSSNTFIINGGTINNTSVAAITTNNYAQTWGGDFTFTGTNALNLGTGAVTLGATRQVTVSGSTLTIGGAIGESAAGYGLTKAGAGTLALTGTTSNYTGATSINAGTLSFAGLGSLGTGTEINFGGGTLLYGTGNTADISGRTVTLNSGGGSIDTGANNVTFANAVGNSGTGALSKLGSGSLTLSGSNSYTGLTTVLAGTLNLASGSTIDSATVSAASTILGGSGTITNSLTVGGGGSVSPGSATSAALLSVGSVTLNGGGSYLWNLLDTGAAGGTGYDQIVVGGGTGTVNVGASSGSQFTIKLNSAGATPTGWSSATAYNFDIISGALSGFATDKFSINTAAFTPSFNGVWSLSDSAGNLRLTYTPGASDIIIDIPSGTETQTGAGYVVLTGAGNLVKSGAGELRLTNSANNYTGTTAVNMGVISISVDAPNSASGALGNAATSVLIGDTSGSSIAGINIDTAGVVVSRGLSVRAGSSGVKSIGGTNTTGTVTYSGNTILADNIELSATSGGTVALEGIVSGDSFGITKVGDGTVTFGGANSYTGGTAVNAGTLATIGAERIANTSAVSLSESAILSLGGAETVGSIAGAGLITYGGSYLLTAGGNNTNTIFSGGLSGVTGSFTKAGNGTLTLSGDNSSLGGTMTLSSGGLAIASGTAMGSGPLVLNGGTFQSNDATGLSVANLVTIGGNVGLGASSTGTLTFGAAIGMGSGTRTLAVASPVIFNGAVTNGGIIKTGAGLLTIKNASNTLTGLSITSGSAAIDTGAQVNLTNGALNTSSLTALTISGTLLNNSTTSLPSQFGTVTVASGGSIIQQGNGSPTNFLFTGSVPAVFQTGSTFILRDYTSSPSVSGRTYAGNLTLDSSGSAVSVGSVSGSGTWAVGGDLTIGTNVTFNFASNTLTTSFAGNVTVDGIFGGTNGARSFTIGSGKNLILGSGGSVVMQSGQSVSINGGVVYNGATTAGTITGGITLGAGPRIFNVANGNAAEDLTVSGAISGSGGIDKTGAGTLQISNASNYSGATSISNGVLRANGANSLGGTSGITIQNGGTLLLAGATNRINNGATIALSGGKLDAGGLIEGSSGVVGMGVLSQTASSVIDFGGGGSLAFSAIGDLNPGTATLSIWNWTTGATQFFVNTGAAGDSFSNIRFYSGDDSTGFVSGGVLSGPEGNLQLVPVPEVGALFGALGLLAPLAWRERRHWMRCREARVA